LFDKIVKMEVIILKTKVLFLCTGNSCRSQMAEAFMRKYAADKYEVYSAGLEAQGIHPKTIKVMKEIGIDLSTRLYWPFDDPRAVEGSEEEIISKFREVRDQIEQKIKEFIKEREK